MGVGTLGRYSTYIISMYQTRASFSIIIYLLYSDKDEEDVTEAELTCIVETMKRSDPVYLREQRAAKRHKVPHT